ncbi:MAG: deoxynucleoside kinase [Betaproteobacteria bacterium]|nr:deoxynucleoside kinase [Betaproteobacteria bacterium]
MIRLSTPIQAHRIEICGGIASGKTTLANLLVGLDILPIRENFQVNPFWRSFYADPLGTAFETEVSFLLQHYHDIKDASRLERLVACDFSLYLDLSYAHVTLPPAKCRAFMAVYREIKHELGVPSLLIHLRCDPKVELERIRRRGRKVEKPITLGYLQEINTHIVKALTATNLVNGIVEIDSGLLDFAHDAGVQDIVLRQIHQKLTALNVV